MPLAALAAEQRRGDAVVWITPEGFFWFPRTLPGIEGHLTAFYDCPDLLKEMCEDMSCNHGPMLSPGQNDEFLAPYYRRLVPALAGRGIVRIRLAHPRVKMIGAFDKTVMHLGEARIRAELERLYPVMVQGGYIPACDHHPPEVSLGDYRLYVRLLREY